MITEEIVLEQIKQVIDPDVGLNIVDMGLIYGVDINDDIVDITMTLTSPGCPAAPQLLNGSQTVVQQLDGVEEVNINVVWTPPWDPEMMSEEAKDELGIF
ncbi:TPA: aromatic ring hydroxylase [Candidatus Poribacteria bacterium]|uniref:MIP18 family-like domain-containing protein n=1 Tax=marine metagenome TaxID=408172 RepID=A0A382EPZ8_9ZZZZ|nr:aromatic ring hydroxylase [Candidatus Poribacteria bacterium]MAP86045.1 aromatic ring hydroxylase [Candidatus Poribacteria bacterium]MAP87763.1 aromatic ring hydroxylase [Candidatus Poribacteria bacterium]MCS5611464.1 metal-sulfur cluster assembly factor [Candidatus Poribacteria bacterium]MEE2618717.1 metal-sulfur cluster assembly factor [Candidatus Poribacteria bacterium]